MKSASVIACALVALLVGTSSAPAREKKVASKPAPAKSTCDRASFPGDPICDVGGDSGGSLPTPTDRQGARSRESGVAVSDELSVKGRSNFNDNRYGGTGLNNPNMRPGALEGVNGGGGLNYKF